MVTDFFTESSQLDPFLIFCLYCSSDKPTVTSSIKSVTQRNAVFYFAMTYESGSSETHRSSNRKWKHDHYCAKVTNRNIQTVTRAFVRILTFSYKAY